MGATLKINLTQGTQDVANNRTYVSGNVQVTATGSTYNQAAGSTRPTGSLSGTFSGSWSKGFGKGVTTTLYSFAGWVTHDAEGRATVNVSAAYNTRVSPGTIYASASLPLTQIPRASDIAIDKTSVMADGLEQLIATATKKSESFVDILTVSIGEYSKEVVSGEAFAIPKEWCNAIPNTSGKANVTVTTMLGDTVIGSNSVEVDVQVPEDIIPVINAVDITEAVSKVTDAFGDRFVQDLTQLNVVIDAAGAYNSTVKSYTTKLDGVTYIQQAFTSNVLISAGSLFVEVTVTDSRGRTASTTRIIEVVEYRKPVITDLRYMHCDESGNALGDGKCTKVTVSARAYPVNGANTKGLLIRYKSAIDEIYTTRIVDISELDWEFTAEVVISNTEPTVTYEYVVELFDKLHSDTAKISTGIPVISRKAGGTGVTLFEEALLDGFVVGGGKPATVNDLTVKGKLNLEAGGIGADYVVEEGVSGIWYYKKWNSGKAECWTNGDTMLSYIGSSPTALLGGYYSYKNIALPFEFTKIEHAHANGRLGTGIGLCHAVAPDYSSVTVYIVGNQSSNAMHFSCEVKGEWLANGETAEMTATHDGNGNVTVYGVTAIHDGNGNVTIL